MSDCCRTTFVHITKRMAIAMVICTVVPCVLLPSVIQLNNGRVYVQQLPELLCEPTTNATLHSAWFSGPYATINATCDGIGVTLEYPSPPRLWNWATGDEVRDWASESHRHAFVDRNATVGFSAPYRLTFWWWTMLIVSITLLFVLITCSIVMVTEATSTDTDDSPPTIIKRRTVPNYTTPLVEEPLSSTAVLEIASVGRE